MSTAFASSWRSLTAIGLGLLTLLAGVSNGSAAEWAHAVFAGGCFWCMEPPFDAVPGVVATVPGYTGGKRANARYKQVSVGGTGHVEAIEVTYDPARVSYDQLLAVFWRNIDPLDDGGQFCDRGDQYRSAIFYATEEEKEAAVKSRDAVMASSSLNGTIVTAILPANVFYPAEEDHQDYYKRNPIRYKYYSFACGRGQRLKALWGKARHS